jgi:GntR family transcriptional regulator
MLLQLESASGQPLYRQVVDQVKRMVASGALRPGDRLPTVRELAGQLIVNPNTIAHAYQEMERDGIIETRRGLGSFVAENETRLSDAARRETVARLIHRALVEAHHVQLSADDVRSILEERLRTLEQPEVTRK